MTAADGAVLEIRRLEGRDEAWACARMMAASEPWITLRRDAEAALAILTDPEREFCVALIEDELVGFIILVMPPTGRVCPSPRAGDWHEQRRCRTQGSVNAYALTASDVASFGGLVRRFFAGRAFPADRT